MHREREDLKELKENFKKLNEGLALSQEKKDQLLDSLNMLLELSPKNDYATYRATIEEVTKGIIKLVQMLEPITGTYN